MVRSPLYEKGVYHLFHATHVSNLESILKLGIYSRDMLKKIGLNFKDISDPDIQKKRASRKLHSFVPTLLNLTCPFIRRVVEEQKGNVVVLDIHPSITNKRGTIFSYGNAASRMARFIELSDEQSVKKVDWSRVFDRYRGNDEELKKLSCSEVLIKEHIPPQYVRRIVIPMNLVKRVKSILDKLGIDKKVVVADRILAPINVA